MTGFIRAIASGWWTSDSRTGDSFLVEMVKLAMMPFVIMFYFAVGFGPLLGFFWLLAYLLEGS